MLWLVKLSFVRSLTFWVNKDITPHCRSKSEAQIRHQIKIRRALSGRQCLSLKNKPIYLVRSSVCILNFIKLPGNFVHYTLLIAISLYCIAYCEMCINLAAQKCVIQQGNTLNNKLFVTDFPFCVAAGNKAHVAFSREFRTSPIFFSGTYLAVASFTGLIKRRESRCGSAVTAKDRRYAACCCEALLWNLLPPSEEYGR